MFCNMCSFYSDGLLPTFSQKKKKKMDVQLGSALAVYRF
jgi:hypothetical protein